MTDFHIEHRKDKPGFSIIWIETQRAREWVWEHMNEELHWVTTKEGGLGVEVKKADELGPIEWAMVRDGLKGEPHEQQNTG